MIGDPPLLWYPLADRPNFVEGSLPRLTSAVVKITAVAELGPTTIVADEVEGLRYKAYLENEEQSCAEVAEMADGERTFPALPFGTTMYVIVANNRYWDGLSYKVRVEPASS